MKITKLHITNFLTIGGAVLSLDDKGLVLIQGQNDDDPSADSNGAGKSSVPDALCWALYGETARGVKGDDVINDTAKKGTEVRVIMTDGEDEYLIARHRKHKTHKNGLIVIKNGDDITKGTDKLTQVLVNEVMGCTLEVFRAAVYAGQELMPDLPGMTDKFLKTLIEEGAGIERLQAAYEIAKRKNREAIDAQCAAGVALDKGEIQLGNYHGELGAQKATVKDWVIDRDATIKLKSDEAKNKIAEAKEYLAGVDLAVDAKVQSCIAKLESKIFGLKGERDAVVALRGEAEGFQKAHTKQISRVEQAIKEFRASQKWVDNIADQVGTNCGECGKEYHESDLDDAKETGLAKMKALDLVLKEAKITLGNTKRDLDKALGALKKFEDGMTDASVATSQLSDLKSKLRASEKLQSASDAEKRLAVMLVNDVKELKAKTNPHEKSVATLEGKITDQHDTNCKLTAAMLQADDHLALTAEAVKVFGPAGVRAHILDTVTPYLNERTSHYLGALSDGNIVATWNTLSTTAKGDLREKFNIDVVNLTGAKSFAGLSGGEKRKVRLATAMALQDMVASRATKPISLFIADEVDDALDDAGLERLMGILDEKARDRGTVLVISHNSLTDWIRDHAIVTKSGGLATVTGALSV